MAEIVDQIATTLGLGAVTAGFYAFYQYRYRVNVLTKSGVCSRCEGQGRHECTLCYGRGSISQPGYINVADPYHRSSCKRCMGTGLHECRVCSGSGKAEWLVKQQASQARAPPVQPTVVSVPRGASPSLPSAAAASPSAVPGRFHGAAPTVSPLPGPSEARWVDLERRLSDSAAGMDEGVGGDTWPRAEPSRDAGAGKDRARRQRAGGLDAARHLEGGPWPGGAEGARGFRRAMPPEAASGPAGGPRDLGGSRGSDGLSVGSGLLDDPIEFD